MSIYIRAKLLYKSVWKLSEALPSSRQSQMTLYPSPFLSPSLFSTWQFMVNNTENRKLGQGSAGVFGGNVEQTMPLRVLNKSPAKHTQNSLTIKYPSAKPMWVCLLLLLCGVFSHHYATKSKKKRRCKGNFLIGHTLTSLKKRTIENIVEFLGFVSIEINNNFPRNYKI